MLTLRVRESPLELTQGDNTYSCSRPGLVGAELTLNCCLFTFCTLSTDDRGDVINDLDLNSLLLFINKEILNNWCKIKHVKEQKSLSKS